MFEAPIERFVQAAASKGTVGNDPGASSVRSDISASPFFTAVSENSFYDTSGSTQISRVGALDNLFADTGASGGGMPRVSANFKGFFNR